MSGRKTKSTGFFMNWPIEASPLCWSPADWRVVIVVVSRELREVMGIWDGLIVMCQGRISGVLTRAEATEAKVLQLALPGGAPMGATVGAPALAARRACMSLKTRKSDVKHETLALCRRLQPAADLRVPVCRPVAVGEVFLFDAKHDRPGIVGFANRDGGMHD